MSVGPDVRRRRRFVIFARCPSMIDASVASLGHMWLNVLSSVTVL
jgi:hypothetical protein